MARHVGEFPHGGSNNVIAYVPNPDPENYFMLKSTIATYTACFVCISSSLKHRALFALTGLDSSRPDSTLAISARTEKVALNVGRRLLPLAFAVGGLLFGFGNSGAAAAEAAPSGLSLSIPSYRSLSGSYGEGAVLAAVRVGQMTPAIVLAQILSTLWVQGKSAWFERSVFFQT